MREHVKLVSSDRICTEKFEKKGHYEAGMGSAILSPYEKI